MKFRYDFQFSKPESLVTIENLSKQHYLASEADEFSLSPEAEEFIRRYFSGYFSVTPPSNAVDHLTRENLEVGAYHLTDIITTSGGQPDKANCGITACIHTNYSMPVVHDHTFFEVVCVIYGNCLNTSGDQTIEMTEGDILILAPGTKHSISVFDDKTFVMNILINPSVFKETFFHFFSEYDLMYVFFSNVLCSYTVDSFIFFHIDPDPVIMAALYQLNSMERDDLFYDEQIKIPSVSLLFARILAYHEKNAIIYNDVFSGAHQNIALILYYIQEHFNTVTLSELSHFFNYSERQLLRMLKAYTGKGFKETIQYLRVHHAARLLAESDRTVEEIADSCGYTSRALRKLFIAYFNRSPSDYRKQQRSP
ncbi:MAG: AraC family transcriptional regulator [Clostridiales Family XIII bacterium]|nr:AraC family transcriptional regulator [Clostridiales Family XIII bacterium]